MNLADRIALVGVLVTVVGIAIPIGFEVLRQRNRSKHSFHFWIEHLNEANHYCASHIATDSIVGEDLRVVLEQRIEKCLDALGENADVVESRLAQAKSEDKAREPYKLFHLMTTELQRLAKNPIDRDAALFSYATSSILILLLGVKVGRDEAFDLLALSEAEYSKSPTAANQQLWPGFVHLAITSTLLTKVQREIAARSRKQADSH